MTLRFLFAFFVTFAMWTHAQAEKLQPTEDNFSSAMADIYFQKVIDRGGDNAFAHMREVSSVDNQNIIRENRDTLYSWGIFDVTEGLTLTLPPSDDLYMSALVIDNDSYIVREEDADKTGDIGICGSRTRGPYLTRSSGHGLHLHHPADTDRPDAEGRCASCATSRYGARREWRYPGELEFARVGYGCCEENAGSFRSFP
jgi:hypothetical protein